MTEATYLSVKWTVSRGRETFGYNIVTLTDTTTGKRYRCNGGGYDMVGTVFGQWLQDVHADALAEIAGQAHIIRPLTGDRIEQDYGRSLYGMTASYKDTARPVHIYLDGACGFESMRTIAKAIGLTVKSMDVDRKGNARGYLIERES